MLGVIVNLVSEGDALHSSRIARTKFASGGFGDESGLTCPCADQQFLKGLQMARYRSKVSLARNGILFVSITLLVGCSGRDAALKEPVLRATAVVSQSPRIVTFYNGGKITDRWEAKRYTTTSDNGLLFFYLAEELDPHVLCGTYVIEPKLDGASADSTDQAAVRPNPEYKVCLYSDDKLVRTFLVNSFNVSEDGKLYLFQEVGAEAIVVNGTFTVEPVVQAGATVEPAVAVVALYSGARLVRSWNATRYSAATAKVYLWIAGASRPIVVSGSCIITPKSP